MVSAAFRYARIFERVLALDLEQIRDLAKDTRERQVIHAIRYGPRQVWSRRNYRHEPRSIRRSAELPRRRM